MDVVQDGIDNILDGEVMSEVAVEQRILLQQAPEQHKHLCRAVRRDEKSSAVRERMLKEQEMRAKNVEESDRCGH